MINFCRCYYLEERSSWKMCFTLRNSYMKNVYLSNIDASFISVIWSMQFFSSFWKCWMFGNQFLCLNLPLLGFLCKYFKLFCNCPVFLSVYWNFLNCFFILLSWTFFFPKFHFPIVSLVILVISVGLDWSEFRFFAVINLLNSIK